MVFIIVLILLEILTILVLKDHFYKSSRPKFWLSLLIHVSLSIWLWLVIFKNIFYNGIFDTPGNIRLHMAMTGLIAATAIPRMVICLLHYTGKLFRIRKGGHHRWLTWSGLIVSCIILVVIALGTFIGKFNFKTEEVTIKIKGTDREPDTLRIVQISDLHLAGFDKHLNRLQEVIDEVNRFSPDLIINTGDFISYGWHEFDRCDTILAKARSRYGNFAILGNHDMGTYLPEASDEDRKAVAVRVNELATASGYDVLNDEHVIVNIRDTRTAIIGVETYGRHPDIIHGDLKKAMEGLDSVDLKILLCHDPNQWRQDVTGKTDIDLTLAGHTHGMQIGIVTRKFRWSPSKYFYHEWNGLFREGDQYLYVNRGLGVMAIPFRIWMPPEITVLTFVME
ncbi:MAG: metallophosphoesterase [Bacteroidia bacterium]|nr:metallophosphoesterase [Bacteroidia bacterium]